MRRIKITLLLAIVALLLGSATLLLPSKGIDLNSMDLTVNPGDDFYHFANGRWLRENPIPASESRWGSFNLVSERNNALLRSILENAGKNTTAPMGSTIQKVGTFYRLFMDTLKRDQEGSKPVIPLLTEIESLGDQASSQLPAAESKALIQMIAKLHQLGLNCFFSFNVSEDLKNATAHISYFSQSGLGLPDRDYYLKSDKKSEDIRAAYREHMVKNASLFNDQFSLNNEKVIAFETELAKVSMTRTERRNQERQYNKFSVTDLLVAYPNLHFDLYFSALKLKSQDSVIVSQPAFFNRLNQLFAEKTLSEAKDYLKWCVKNQTASYLGSNFEKEHFHFYGTVLTGAKEQKPLWKRAIAASNGVVGELLGQLFVEKAFSPNSKKRINEMVDHIVDAFKERILALNWMSAPTKQKALEKLASFTRKFGYPDKWRDYSKLQIKNDSYLQNIFRSTVFEFEDMTSQLGKPIDKTRWEMLPQTVNAYYNPTMNEIVFPCAIMQAPFFDSTADEALNYGSIGAVIGHELTHGFDDQGSKYAADGNLKSWWTDTDRKLFEEKTKMLVNQYNGFLVNDSLHVNGELTLGENIADLGGLTIAYDAYQKYLKTHPRALIDGYTPEQRFFIGFAQIWKNNTRPEAMRQLVLTDPHSPGEFRVFGPLSNMPSFYAAFNVQAGQKMYKTPQERADIW